MQKIVSCLLVILFCFMPPLYGEQSVTISDEDFLEMIGIKSFRFFENESDKHTGLVRDRAPNFPGKESKAPASIAAVGFALTAYGVAVERGWMSRGTAHALTLRTLKFLLKRCPHKKGFFYHFLDIKSGKRVSQSELSPIDTALLLSGVLFVSEYFNDPKITKLANEIYERVDFQWMLNKGKTLAMSWSPEAGFSKNRWDHFDESLLLYVLAIGSPTYPIPADSWYELARPVGSYKNYRIIQMPPLFTHQYPHIWLDFKNKNDGLADYFKNSVNATLANRQFCIDESSRYKTYGPNTWGLTASQGPGGYRAYGAPPGWAIHDGTIAPTGAGASIVFTPKESIACLRNLYKEYGDMLWGRYGFSDSFNIDKKWYSGDVLAIDQGAMLLMIENYRSGLIWKTMQKNEAVKRAFKKIGFKEGSMYLPWPKAPEYEAPFVSAGIKVDGYLKDWSGDNVIVLNKSSREFGTVNDDNDLWAEVRFAWDEKMLYFITKVTDDSIFLKRSGRHIWRDDLLEIYVDPEGDGLEWKNEDDFQIGIRPAKDESENVQSWAWFQKGGDLLGEGKVVAKSFVDKEGYILEGGIRWDYLGIEPVPGQIIRISPAIHDTDLDRSTAKLQWFFRSENGFQKFSLGKIKLMGPEK